MHNGFAQAQTHNLKIMRRVSTTEPVAACKDWSVEQITMTIWILKFGVEKLTKQVSRGGTTQPLVGAIAPPHFQKIKKFNLGF